MKFLLLSLLLLGTFAGEAEDTCAVYMKKKDCKSMPTKGACRWDKKAFPNCVPGKSAPGGPSTDMDAQLKGITDMLKTIMSRDKRKDEVVIGVNWNWPPFCYSTYETDPDTGNAELVPVGFLYEVAKEACERAGLSCRFHIMGVGQIDCWTPDEQIGSALQSGMFDMCLCYTVTPGRLGKSIWPTNREKGWTKQAEGGLLTLAEYADSDMMDPFGGLQSRWDWLKMDWNDGCDGATMKFKEGTGTEPGRWVDKCKIEKGYETCQKTCHQGKVRIGLIQGWALRPESFNWVTNSFTGKIPDKSRVIWIDEHIDADVSKPIKTYNHLAKALLDKSIDMAYTYANLLEAMVSETCNICSDASVWRDDKLKWSQKKLWFSAGGAAGFFKKGDVALRDTIDAAAKDLLQNDTDKYCNMCLKYWPDKNGCEGHCIGCGNSGTRLCQKKGT